MLLAAALVFELSRESLTGTHYRYREYVNGLPTENYVWSAEAPPPFSKAEAVPPHSRRWLNGRVIRRTIVFEHPFEPYAHDYDDTTGALIRRTPLFFRGKPARVFDPNPVVAQNDPALQDRNDSAGAVPAAAYKDVELADAALHGPHVTLVDRQSRNVAPPEGALVFDREQDGFEDVSAYFHIDRNQRYLQSLGFVGARAVVPYAIEVDAHAASGADNSYFIPSSTEAGKGTLYFGEGGTDDAEDADLLVHEYAHAIIEWIAPGTFGGAFASEARALGEGIGDYWAYSAHVDARRASGRDPYCFADWDARCWQDAPSESCGYAEGTDCLRRLDSTKTMADYETSEMSGVEHRNGAIWASALREIHERAGREVTDKIVIESLFGAPPRPTFEIMAERLLQADRLLYRGAHFGAICTAMRTRDIVTRCDRTPRGEWMLFQSPLRGISIPENSPIGVTSTITIDDTRLIDELRVRVDVQHPARGDLFVELTAPDGTKILLHQISSSRTPDLHVTFGLDAVPAQSLDVLRGRSAAGTWTLFVADRRSRDVGRFESWGLEIRFEGERPRATRPRGESTQTFAVVGHLYGQNGLFASDLRVTNPRATSQTVTLVFTPGNVDGTTEFAAMRVAIGPGETLASDDVVQRLFHATGSGTLEVLGDVTAMSRTYLATPDGTFGDALPPDLETAPADTTLYVARMVPDDSWRMNVGISERSGRRTSVRVGRFSGTSIAIEPFGHVQIPVDPTDEVLAIYADGGGAMISAYLSQVDPRTGDAMIIPAQRSPSNLRPQMAPIISTTAWRTDLRLFAIEPRVIVDGVLTVDRSYEYRPLPAPGFGRSVYVPDVMTLFHGGHATGALTLRMAPGVVAGAWIRTDTTSQYVPFLDVQGAEEQHLPFIEQNSDYRTNVGIVSENGATAEVIVYDAAGVEIERHGLFTMGGVIQRAIESVVTHGRAVVRFTSGTGRAYASLIDLRSGDATFFPAR